jgi:D-serine deaminase-like pyridoxal phosphate-dependent protein
MAMPTPPDSRPIIQETLDLFDQSGLPHPIVSGGATPFVFTAHRIPELTEMRAGEYPTGGLKHLRGGTHTVEQCALRLLTTVVSRAVLDAGSKSLSAVVTQDEGRASMGYIVEYPRAHLTGASEEHGSVDVSACEPPPQIGECVLDHPRAPVPHRQRARRDRRRASGPGGSVVAGAC